MFYVSCDGYGSVCDFFIDANEKILSASGPPILFPDYIKCFYFMMFLKSLYPEEKFLICKSSGSPDDK